MININVADKLAELDIKDEVLLKQVRELASFAFEQGKVIGYDDGKKDGAKDGELERLKDPKTVVKKKNDVSVVGGGAGFAGTGGEGGNGAWVDDNYSQASSTSEMTNFDRYLSMIEFVLTIKNSDHAGKLFRSQMQVTKELVYSARSKQQLFGVILQKMMQETAHELTDKNIEEKLL